MFYCFTSWNFFHVIKCPSLTLFPSYLKVISIYLLSRYHCVGLFCIIQKMWTDGTITIIVKSDINMKSAKQNASLCSKSLKFCQ